MVVRVKSGQGNFVVDVYESNDPEQLLRDLFESDKADYVSSGREINEDESFCDDDSAFLTGFNFEIRYEVINKKEDRQLWYEFREMDLSRIKIKRYDCLDDLFLFNSMLYGGHICDPCICHNYFT